MKQKLISVVRIGYIALLLGSSGCLMYRRSGVQRKFPEGIRAESYGALNYAEEVIKSKGIHSIRPRSVEVQVVSGHRNFGRDGWSFIYVCPQWYPNGIEVLGIAVANGRRVLVGHRPGDPNDINIGTLRHEMAHHWLVASGYVDMYHYPVYDRYFDGWANGRRAMGRSAVSDDGETFNVHEVRYSTDEGVVIMTMVAAGEVEPDK